MSERDPNVLTDEQLVAEIGARLGPEVEPMRYEVCPSCGEALEIRQSSDGEIVVARPENHECWDRRQKFLLSYGSLKPGEYVFKCDCGDRFCTDFQVHRPGGLTQHHLGEVAAEERLRELLREVTTRFVRSR